MNSRSRIFSHLSVSLLAVFFVLAILQLEFDGLKGLLVDALFRTQWWKSPSQQIVLIAYDDESSVRYDGLTRIPATEFEKVFEVLAGQKPRAIGVLGNLNEKSYSDSELASIAHSLEKTPNTYIGYLDDESLGKEPPAALRNFPYLPGFVSRDTFSYGADSVSRRVMLTIDGIPTLYNKLACSLDEQNQAACMASASRHEKLGDSLQAYILWQGRAGTYPIYSTSRTIAGQIPKDLFKDKIVLIGTTLHSKRGMDHIFTPYSRAQFGTTALEGAANGLAALMDQKVLKKTPSLFDWCVAILISLLTVNMVLVLSPGKGIFFVLSELVALFLMAWVSLFVFHRWMDAAHPLLIVCVGYYLVIPYRLIDEYRKRWHYQEKSELMIQLEQLKSNFLSLVSHDLKTPIARIQGNAELVLNESAALSAESRKKLHAIVNTSEDLSQYVETVLDLTRIESARVPLQKVSKDINSTIKEVVQSRKSLAAEKGIELETRLEPLFSIKFDAKLIRRVLSNIVENAIKYSPPNTRIVLSSKEEGNWIRVSVQDQGIGVPKEEQEKVFQKFYRYESDETKEIKGTGLGLYLVKYFVELHKGVVELKSEVGQGSTFTVSLPV